METLVGTQLGGYTLTRLLGSGGMGSVYLAEDRTIGQQVAIKVIRNDEEDFSDSASAGRAEERFKQEARAVASLDHLHILPLYRYGEEETASGTRAYMVMQYRPEGSLGDWLRRRAGTISSTSLSMAPKLPHDLPNTWPLSVEEAGDYLLQAASALQYAHEQGIIHRDVKPANFLLRYDTRAASGTGKIFLLLSDFGLARFFSAVSGTSHVLGTPTYMAPEQFDGIAGPESDQYALAIMVYYLLAGRPPFQGDPLHLMHQHLSAEPPPIRAANPAIASGVENVLARALAKKPAQRYPSIAAFAEDFTRRMYEGTAPRRLTLSAAPNNSRPSFPATRAPLMNGVPTVSAPSGGITHNTPAQVIAPTVNVHADAQSLHTQRPLSLLQPMQAATPPIALQANQDTPKKQRVSRRNALAWIIGGTAVATFCIGSGIYFYVNQQPAQVKSVLTGHSDEVTALAWSPSGAQLASSSRDHTVRLWNVNNQSALVYKGHAAAVQAVAWNPQGTLLASGGRDNQVLIWNPAGNTLYRSSLFRSAVSALAWSTNGDELYIGTSGNGVHRFTLASSKTSLEANRAIIRAVAISPDGNFIATGTDGGRMTIVPLKASGTSQVQNYENHLEAILSLAWSPDSTKIAFSRSDKTVGVVSLTTASITSTLSLTSAVNGLAWEPVSGERLATVASDGTLHIWTPENNKYTSYDAHAGALTSAAWGGHGLATGSTDAKILIWKV
ncbi:MAG: serine/threonine protein kinase [Chloroflexota bacterium]|nr:serine/threonine protein kinase [Chloroflexota bacterium]